MDQFELDVVWVAEDEGGEGEWFGDFGDVAARDVQLVEVGGPQVEIDPLVHVDRYVVEARAVLLKALALMRCVVIEADVEAPVCSMQEHRVPTALVVLLDAQALHAKDSAVPRLTGRHVADRETHMVEAPQGRGVRLADIVYIVDVVAVEVTVGDHVFASLCIINV